MIDSGLYLPLAIVVFVIMLAILIFVPAPSPMAKREKRNYEYEQQQRKELLRKFLITKQNGRDVVNVEHHWGKHTEYDDMNAISFAYYVRDRLNIDIESTLEKMMDLKPGQLIGGEIHDNYVEFYWGGEIELLRKQRLEFEPYLFMDRKLNLMLGITHTKYFSTTTWEEIPKPQHKLTVDSPWLIQRGYA